MFWVLATWEHPVPDNVGVKYQFKTHRLDSGHASASHWTSPRTPHIRLGTMNMSTFSWILHVPYELNSSPGEPHVLLTDLTRKSNALIDWFVEEFFQNRLRTCCYFAKTPWMCLMLVIELLNPGTMKRVHFSTWRHEFKFFKLDDMNFNFQAWFQHPTCFFQLRIFWSMSACMKRSAKNPNSFVSWDGLENWLPKHVWEAFLVVPYHLIDMIGMWIDVANISATRLDSPCAGIRCKQAFC